MIDSGKSTEEKAADKELEQKLWGQAMGMAETELERLGIRSPHVNTISHNFSTVELYDRHRHYQDCRLSLQNKYFTQLRRENGLIRTKEQIDEENRKKGYGKSNRNQFATGPYGFMNEN